MAVPPLCPEIAPGPIATPDDATLARLPMATPLAPTAVLVPIATAPVPVATASRPICVESVPTPLIASHAAPSSIVLPSALIAITPPPPPLDAPMNGRGVNPAAKLPTLVLGPSARVLLCQSCSSTSQVAAPAPKLWTVMDVDEIAVIWKSPLSTSASSGTYAMPSELMLWAKVAELPPGTATNETICFNWSAISAGYTVGISRR